MACLVSGVTSNVESSFTTFMLSSTYLAQQHQLISTYLAQQHQLVQSLCNWHTTSLPS